MAQNIFDEIFTPLGEIANTAGKVISGVSSARDLISGRQPTVRTETLAPIPQASGFEDALARIALAQLQAGSEPSALASSDIDPRLMFAVRQQLDNMNQPNVTQLGTILNRQAVSQAQGAPTYDREALIRHLRARDGNGGSPFGTFGSLRQPLQSASPPAPVPSSGAMPAGFTNFPAGPQGPMPAGRSGSFLGSGVMSGNSLALGGGILGGLALANKLGLGDALRGLIGGPSAGGSITASDLFGFPATSAEQEAIGNAGSGAGSFDFSSLANVTNPAEWTWVPDELLTSNPANFADLGLGIDLNP